MRVAITSFGSTGDFEPFFALALALKARGHQPVLAFPPQLALRAESLGIAFVPVGTEALFEAVGQMIRSQFSADDPESAAIPSFFSPEGILKLMGDLMGVCKKAEFLICSAEWPFGKIVHELTGIPLVSVHLDYFSEKFDRCSREKVDEYEAQLASFVNPLRVGFGLEPTYSMITEDGISDQLTLFAMSQLILDPSEFSDWKAHYHVTGFFFLDQAEKNWTPDAALVSFLSEGPPPLFLSMGSMVFDRAEALWDAVLKVVTNLGQRIVVQGFDSQLQRGRLPPSVCPCGFVPYYWILPQVSGIIQSGGAGATAWAMRLGVPSVCLPKVFQQESYAAFCEHYGCGVSISFDELSYDALKKSVSEILGNRNIHKDCSEVKAILSAEAGVEGAVIEIENWYAKELEQSGGLVNLSRLN